MAEVAAAAAAEARGCSEAPDGVRRPRGDPARPGPASRGARGSVRFVPGLLGLGGRGTAQPGGGGAEAGAVAAQVPRAPHEAGARRWGGGECGRPGRAWAASRGARGRDPRTAGPRCREYPGLWGVEFDASAELCEPLCSQNEARKLNHQEVVEEDKRLKLPPNWEAKKARLEWELKVEEKKKECAARGEDYERVKLLEISAEDAERWERKKKRKNPDLGFSDYAAAQLRQYQRLTRQIKPDLEQYEKLKEQYGEALYPTSDSLLHGTHVPTKEGIDRMVADLEKQIEKREKYSRRRPYNDDADIDYINERNAKFNKKAERFYGKYTAEIKQNLERGTAV
uniref:Pre-mRNA-splicing factor SYF2 n=2 Tax=Anas platyrhynchos TaxID=8839 RepID=A0A8B9R126_ANAPL